MTGLRQNAEHGESPKPRPTPARCAGRMLAGVFGTLVVLGCAYNRPSPSAATLRERIVPVVPVARRANIVQPMLNDAEATGTPSKALRRTPQFSALADDHGESFADAESGGATVETIDSDTSPVPIGTWLPESVNGECGPADPTLQLSTEALDLQQALAWADQFNPTLRQMRALARQASAGRDIAFAALLPQASGSYRGISGTASPVDRYALPTIPTAVGNMAFGEISDSFLVAELRVQWLVWDFGRVLGKYGQADARAKIANLQYQRARQTVAFDVAMAYFEVLRARAMRRIATEAVARAQSQLLDSESYLSQGTLDPNGVLVAQVQLSETQLLLVESETAEATAVAGFIRVMGLNVSSGVTLVDTTALASVEQSLEDCLRLSAAERPEFSVVLEQIRASQFAAGIARAEFFPKIEAAASGIHQDAHDVPSGNLLAGGLILTQGLYTGGERVATARAAQAGIDEAYARGQQVCDNIAYEVRAAYLALADARKRIQVAQTTVLQATENLRQFNNRFAQGDAIATDVVIAQYSLTRARQTLATAIYDYQVNIARLEYAVGQSLTDSSAQSTILDESDGTTAMILSIEGEQLPRNQDVPSASIPDLPSLPEPPNVDRIPHEPPAEAIP